MGMQEEGNGYGDGGSNIDTKYSRIDYAGSEAGTPSSEKAIAVKKYDTRKYVFACAIFASLNSVLMGYDVGVMSGAVIFIQEDLQISETEEEILVGILSIVSLFGSLIGGRTSDIIGRKWTIALSAIIFQSGGAIMALAPSFRVLMIGRLTAGVGIGFGVAIAPVYIVEIAPSVARGSLTSFPEIFVNFGILLGYISNYAFSGLSVHMSWRVMLGVGILPSIFLGFALFVIPESPRWLAMKNRIDEARLVLSKTNESEQEVEERLAEILVAAEEANTERYDKKAVWFEILNPSPAAKRMLITGCGIQCFQQITGIEATVYYSPTIFKHAGIQGNAQVLAATVAVGFTKTVFILFATFLIDKLGRKPLLYLSTIGMTMSLLSLSLTLSFLRDNGRLGITFALLSVCANVAFFSVGLGPICWVLSSEIFPLRLRAQASALGAVASRVSSGLVTMTFLSVCRAITVGGTFCVFAVISGLAVLFVYGCVPETKGKSLEQIVMLFEDGGGDWQRREVELGDAERLVSKERLSDSSW
ncbi:unnamed protein product [Linum tenue]|uniref:Major facilitator superfamily (MFS) profile domain-containing protein n=1 Tax=Linum tenue TaxID=586396 RepID=A0AAV0JBS5_9ROSI|nr:unnamed protein product [Linum tenue]